MIGCTNDVIMRRLVAIIQALGERDWFDYLAVIAPLLLSVIAIWISISTARTQNRIALFEIRYNALYQLKTILEFDSLIQGCTESKLIVFFFDAHFGTDIEHSDYTQGLNQIIVAINQLEKYILTKPFVRRKHDRKEILDIIIALKQLMLDIEDDRLSEDNRNKLHALCVSFYDGTFKRLQKNV